jgi:hypothetical protein
MSVVVRSAVQHTNIDMALRRSQRESLVVPRKYNCQIFQFTGSLLLSSVNKYISEVGLDPVVLGNIRK